jgi:3-dehydroquinate dehydratase II
MMVRVLVLHGPNLNLLGTREPEIYGRTTLAEIDAMLLEWGGAMGASVRCVQSNIEGELIDSLHGARLDGTAAVVLNGAGYTHTSVALRDAVVACGLPVIEVHLSNPHAREEFRHTSLLSSVVRGIVSGLGSDSYRLGLEAAVTLARRAQGLEAQTE